MQRTKGYAEVLAVALARGLPIVRAAESAQVSERTARRRLAEDDFRRLVAQRRGEMVNAVAGQFLELCSKAVMAVDDALDLEDAPAVRLRAAALALSHVGPLLDRGDLEDRIAALEAVALQEDSHART